MNKLTGAIKKVFAICILQFKVLIRNIKSEGIIFILPIVFMGIFGLVFSGDDQTRTYRLGLIRSDSQAYSSFKSEVLEQLKQPGDDKGSLFEISEYENYDAAYQALSDDRISAFIDITDNFLPGRYSEPLMIYGEPTDFSFNSISIYIRAATAEYLQIKQDFIKNNSTNIEDNESFNAFNYIAPGMMVYGILILIPSVSGRFVKLDEKNYRFRYFTSRAGAVEIIFGNMLFLIFISIVQILILYYTATLFGFEAKGNLLSGMVIGIPTAVFVIGLGLLVGAFTKTTESANNLSTMLSVILGFLSGSFIAGIGGILEFSIAGKIFQFNDVIPTKWATTALEKVLRDGNSLFEVQNELIILTTAGIVMILFGIYVFYFKKLRRLE